jgi:hypothetical protein
MSAFWAAVQEPPDVLARSIGAGPRRFTAQALKEAATSSGNDNRHKTASLNLDSLTAGKVKVAQGSVQSSPSPRDWQRRPVVSAASGRVKPRPMV